MKDIDEISGDVVEAAIALHRDLGPGLLESVEQLNAAHAKQLLTYLRLTGQQVGLLINFGGATLKEGLKRIVNDHKPSASPRLRVNQISGSNG